MLDRQIFWALLLFTIVGTCCGAHRGSVSECNHNKKLAYRAIVKEDGTLEISCRFVDCVNASNEEPVCETQYHGKGCNNFPQWLHEVKQTNGHKGLQVKCCKYERLLYGRDLGSAVIHKKQGFLGGFSYIKGQENTNKRDGFDVITNVTQEGDGYRIWIYRLRCIPPSTQQQNVHQDYFDTKGGNPSIDYVSAQNVPIPQSSSRGCFDAETRVYTDTRGAIPISELRVGENVLTVHARTSAFRPVKFFLHRDPEHTAKYLTLHTERAGVAVTMTPFHLTFSGACETDPALRTYPLRLAKEVRPGDCLTMLDRASGRLQAVRVTHVTESYRRGIYSPVTGSGVIVTNELVSSCYSFIKNQGLQASIFNVMTLLENFAHRWLSLPPGWLLGGDQSKVDVPRGLDYILSALDRLLPVSKIF